MNRLRIEVPRSVAADVASLIEMYPQAHTRQRGVLVPLSEETILAEALRLGLVQIRMYLASLFDPPNPPVTSN